jgi:hypothetical protein
MLPRVVTKIEQRSPDTRLWQQEPFGRYDALHSSKASDRTE